jgi:uncharacterized membrane protein YuzA (DUF378 family)
MILAGKSEILQSGVWKRVLAALGISYLLFVSFTALYTGELSLSKATFLFAASMLGPLIAISTLWYALVGIVAFGACFILIIKSTRAAACS